MKFDDNIFWLIYKLLALKRKAIKPSNQVCWEWAFEKNRWTHLTLSFRSDIWRKEIKKPRARPNLFSICWTRIGHRLVRDEEDSLELQFQDQLLLPVVNKYQYLSHSLLPVRSTKYLLSRAVCGLFVMSDVVECTLLYVAGTYGFLQSHIHSWSIVLSKFPGISTWGKNPTHFSQATYSEKA